MLRDQLSAISYQFSVVSYPLSVLFIDPTPAPLEPFPELVEGSEGWRSSPLVETR
jgi:hypothetical protein